jgi:CRISPR-associated protein Csd1
VGLLQKACETYEKHEKYVGVSREGHAIMCPVSHIITSAQIEITVDENGKFVSARSVDKNEAKIIIPVTEESGGRTSAPCAHPLCDQIQYIAPYNEEKHKLYVEILSKWTNSEYTHPKLKPILKYIEGETVMNDLLVSNVVKLNDKGVPKDEKMIIRWVVVGLGEENSGPCWTDISLFKSFIDFYSSLSGDSKELCMITGDEAVTAKQHPKGIIPINGNAKLISANDSSNFTYRGRFTTDTQAATISYIASQKAHNAIRWVASEQGEIIGGRTFICCNPAGNKVHRPTNPLLRNEETYTKPSDYKDALRNALLGYKNLFEDDTSGVVIAAFDAATTGRLALTYYNELDAMDFITRLYDWDDICSWTYRQFGIIYKFNRHAIESSNPLEDKDFGDFSLYGYFLIC